MRSWIGTIVALGAMGCGGTAGAPDAAPDAAPEVDAPIPDSRIDAPGPNAGVDAAPSDAGIDAIFFEDWVGTMTDGWPGWSALGGVAMVQRFGGVGVFTPTVSGYTLGRMGHALPAAVDVEATYMVRFSDVTTQGAGLYLRQNGGYLGQSTPHGAGYAAFLEGFQGPRLGIWREQDGVEIEILHATIGPMTDFTGYHVRFRVTQLTPTSTELAAKVWNDGSAEPTDWTVTATDDQVDLQGVSGGVALDAWSTATPQNGLTPGYLTVDKLAVTALP